MPKCDTANSSLFGYLCAIQSGDAANRAEATFTRLTGRSPQLSLSTASYRACLSLSEWDKVGHDAASGISVVLHGEIYHADDHPANYLAQQFANHGFAWAKEIHGSFAILAVDKSADQIVLITDRLNSRRVFASQIEGGICISSHLSAQPWKTYELDLTGVASYIVNRALYNSRTLFRGVSVLKRACIHQLTARGFDAAPYWRDGFDSSPKRANQRQLAAELETRLIQAMRRRLYDSPNVFLSLSAGYDSTALLGILAYDLRIPDVRCFSYDHGAPSPNGDAGLARQMAECAGYSHEIVETYDGNFVAHLRDNAVTCLRRHLSWYCPDLGAWQRLAPRFASVERPVVFNGDGPGWRVRRLSDSRDVLASLQIYEADVLSWLFCQLPKDSRANFEQGLAEDFEQLCAVASREAHGHWHNAIDFVYLDQRLGTLILPWREACIPPGVAVRSPLLDNDVLDFLMRVPAAARSNRNLYRKTITAMYPQLYRFPRCSTLSNYYLNLAQEFAINVAEVRRLIESQSSRLDSLVPPDLLHRMLDDVVEGKAPSAANSRSPAVGGGILARLSRRFRNRLLPPRPEVPRMKPSDVLMRLILLRTALSDDDS
jgi:asparagine synthase (glutamine-hydrolysing)